MAQPRLVRSPGENSTRQNAGCPSRPALPPSPRSPAYSDRPGSAAGAGPFGAAVAAAGAVVIGAGHVHKINGNDEMEDPEFELSQADPLTGETADVDAVGNSDVTSIGRFPHWADAESATESEAVGNLRDRPRNPGKVNQGLIPDFYASWKDSESATETEAVDNAYTLVPERVWRKIKCCTSNVC